MDCLIWPCDCILNLGPNLSAFEYEATSNISVYITFKKQCNLIKKEEKKKDQHRLPQKNTRKAGGDVEWPQLAMILKDENTMHYAQYYSKKPQVFTWKRSVHTYEYKYAHISVNKMCGAEQNT